MGVTSWSWPDPGTVRNQLSLMSRRAGEETSHQYLNPPLIPDTGNSIGSSSVPRPFARIGRLVAFGAQALAGAGPDQLVEVGLQPVQITCRRPAGLDRRRRWRPAQGLPQTGDEIVGKHPGFETDLEQRQQLRLGKSQRLRLHLGALPQGEADLIALGLLHVDPFDRREGLATDGQLRNGELPEEPGLAELLRHDG